MRAKAVSRGARGGGKGEGRREGQVDSCSIFETQLS